MSFQSMRDDFDLDLGRDMQLDVVGLLETDLHVSANAIVLRVQLK